MKQIFEIKYFNQVTFCNTRDYAAGNILKIVGIYIISLGFCQMGTKQVALV